MVGNKQVIDTSYFQLIITNCYKQWNNDLWRDLIMIITIAVVLIIAKIIFKKFLYLIGI